MKLCYVPFINRFVPFTKVVLLSAFVSCVTSLGLFAWMMPTTQQEHVVYVPVETRVDRIAQIAIQDAQNHHVQLDEDTAQELAQAIVDNERMFSIPAHLQLGLIATESHFDQYAISHANAISFWQIMPNVHLDKLTKLYKTGMIDTRNLYDPKTNSMMGAMVLRNCLDKHRGKIESALQCFNGSEKDRSYKYANKVLSNMEGIAI